MGCPKGGIWLFTTFERSLFEGSKVPIRGVGSGGTRYDITCAHVRTRCSVVVDQIHSMCTRCVAHAVEVILGVSNGVSKRWYLSVHVF
jgi:hypothetical protein